MLLWLFVSIGLFVYCLQDDALDDFAGWIPAVLVLQLPALPIAAHAATDEPGALPRGWRIACAISLGLVTAFSVFFCCLIVGRRIWHSDFIEVRPLQNGLLMGAVALIVTSVRFSIRMRQRPHPLALRRGLLELLAVALAFVALVAYEEGSGFVETALGNRGQLLLVAVPFLWMAPLWLLMPRRPRPGPPRATLQ